MIVIVIVNVPGVTCRGGPVGPRRWENTAGPGRPLSNAPAPAASRLAVKRGLESPPTGIPSDKFIPKHRQNQNYPSQIPGFTRNT